MPSSAEKESRGAVNLEGIRSHSPPRGSHCFGGTIEWCFVFTYFLAKLTAFIMKEAVLMNPVTTRAHHMHYLL